MKAIVYNKFAIELFGEFANPNFKEMSNENVTFD